MRQPIWASPLLEVMDIGCIAFQILLHLHSCVHFYSLSGLRASFDLPLPVGPVFTL